MTPSVFYPYPCTQVDSYGAACLSVVILVIVSADYLWVLKIWDFMSTDLLLVTFFFFANKRILYLHYVMLVVHALTHLYRWKEMMNLSKNEELSPARQTTGETNQELKPTRYKVLGSTDLSNILIEGRIVKQNWRLSF